MSNSRSRILVIATFSVIVAAIVLGVLSLKKHSTALGSEAKLNHLPNIESVPGGNDSSVQYLKTLSESNRLQAQKALETGASSVPTILGSSAFEGKSFSASGGFSKSCENLQQKFPYCFDGSNLSVNASQNGTSNQDSITSPLAALLNAGQITAETAQRIAEACATSTEKCSDYLKTLLASGQLTPEQAKRLSKFFKTSPSDELDGVAGLSQLVRSGQLTSEAAKQLLAVCHEGRSKVLCDAALKNLVAKGQLTPEQAKRLLGQLTATDSNAGQSGDQNSLQEPATSKTLGVLSHLLASGKLTPVLAKQLHKVCQKGMPKSVCKSFIERMVASGQLSPADANRLLNSVPSSDSPDSEIAKRIAGMVSNGLSPKVAADVAQACQEDSESCQETIKRLLASGQLTPAQARKLLKGYALQSGGRQMPGDLKGETMLGSLVKKGQLSPELSEDIQNACRKNAASSACAELLNHLIAKGVLTPQQARRLLAAYGKPGLEQLDPLQKASRAGKNVAESLNLKHLNPNHRAKSPAHSNASNSGASFSQSTPHVEATHQRGTRNFKAHANSSARRANRALSGEALPTPDNFRSAEGDARLEQVIQRQNTYINTQNQQQKIRQIQALMKAQATALFTSWTPPVAQTYVKGAEQEAAVGGEAQPSAENPTVSGGVSAPLIAKAGDIIFAVLDTAVNTDNPGPTLATIVLGRYKGGKLIGQITRQKDRVFMQFNLLNLNNVSQTIPINAVAIDPNNARTALASEVNHHYLLRYGTLFASSFLTGLGDAVANSGSSLTVEEGGTIKQLPETNSREKLIIAAGNVGTALGRQLKPAFDTPPTVTVHSGTGMGILFLGDAVFSGTQGAQSGQLTTMQHSGAAARVLSGVASRTEADLEGQAQNLTRSATNQAAQAFNQLGQNQ